MNLFRQTVGAWRRASNPSRASIGVRLRRRHLWLAGTALAGAIAIAPAALADSSGRHDGRAQWVTAWGTSQHPNVTEATVSNATVRMIARVTIPGEAISIRLDNTFSTSPVTIGSAFVGPRVQNANIAAGWNRPMLFNGSPTVVIPAGGSVTSDAVSLRVFAQQDLAVSLYVPGTNVHPSQHGGAVVTSYLSPNGSGDVAANDAGTAFTGTTTSMYWLKAVNVYSKNSPGAIVAFGDSITDGTCTTLNSADRWEDWVAVRLDTQAKGNGKGWPFSGLLGRDGDSGGGHKSIVNEGIGGNTVTRANLAPPPDSIPGIERLDRDVLSHQGVTDVVLFMGTNDIRRGASASQVIAGMQDIIRRVRAQGYNIFGATIIPRHNVAPSGTNTGWDPTKTAIRNEVNRWIRNSRKFDGVLDFDRVVADPSNPDLIYPPFNCGDGIHPSPAGYYEMGKSVDLDLFDGK